MITNSVLLSRSMLVLDPRLKMKYYVEQKWEKKWIDEGRKIITSIYENDYQMAFDQSNSGEMNVNRGNEDEDEEDDYSDLEIHIYGGHQKERVLSDKLGNYLKRECAHFTKRRTTLLWQQVWISAIFIIIMINVSQFKLTNVDFYFQVNKGKYPDLFRIAWDYLTIPASSAPIERVFSRA